MQNFINIYAKNDMYSTEPQGKHGFDMLKIF